MFLHRCRDAHGVASRRRVAEDEGRFSVSYGHRLVAASCRGLLERHVVGADAAGVAEEEPGHEEAVRVGVQGRADFASGIQD